MNAVVNPVLSIPDFESGNIDPEYFDHEAHVYVGCLYVQEYPLTEALGNFDAALRRLVVKVGADGKYHATLTWFFLLLIAERIQNPEPWQVFKQRNPDLLEGSKKLLSRYYSQDVLFSDRARERFVLPNNVAVNK